MKKLIELLNNEQEFIGLEDGFNDVDILIDFLQNKVKTRRKHQTFKAIDFDDEVKESDYQAIEEETEFKVEKEIILVIFNNKEQFYTDKEKYKDTIDKEYRLTFLEKPNDFYFKVLGLEFSEIIIPKNVSLSEEVSELLKSIRIKK